MLKIGIFLAVLIGAWPLAAQAQNEEACDFYAPIPVNVTPVFEEPRFNFDTGIASIQNLVTDSRHSIHENITMGVTHYNPMMEIRVPVKTVHFSDGTACSHVQNAEVTIGYKDVVIYIASEIPRDSCGFDEIMAHEQKHVTVNRQILEEYTVLIQNRLSEYLKLNGTFRESNPDYAASLVREKMQAILNELGEQMIDENRTRQQAIDSRAEYQRITASCDGQLSLIATRYLGNRR